MVAWAIFAPNFFEGGGFCFHPLVLKNLAGTSCELPALTEKVRTITSTDETVTTFIILVT